MALAANAELRVQVVLGPDAPNYPRHWRSSQLIPLLPSKSFWRLYSTSRQTTYSSLSFSARPIPERRLQKWAPGTITVARVTAVFKGSVASRVSGGESNQAGPVVFLYSSPFLGCGRCAHSADGPQGPESVIRRDNTLPCNMQFRVRCVLVPRVHCSWLFQGRDRLLPLHLPVCV